MKRNYLSSLFIICVLTCINTSYARFNQMDPKAEKYPYISPYAYCDNNPLKYIDPDGMEKIMGVTQQETGYKEINKYYNKFGQNNSTIHIWGHGNAKGIILDGKKYTKPKEFQTYLEENSNSWAERDKDGFAMIVLHSCSTGSGDGSFAQEVSKSESFKNVLIVAPNTNVSITSDSKSINESVKSGSAKGLWMMFLNGTPVTSVDGNTKPYLNKTHQKNKHKDKLKSTGETKTAEDHENENKGN